MKKPRILVAEDNDLNRENLVEMLSGTASEITACRDGKEAMEAFSRQRYDLVITDLKMPHVGGMELLKFLKEEYPDTVVVVITGYASVHSAVEAMRLGAFDYITKPLKDDRVQLSIQRALSFALLRGENESLKDQLMEKFDFGKMIGYSNSMKAVFATIEKVAATDSTVIIYGESGTGKELVARALHFNSERKTGPLVTVNCGAIPKNSWKAKCSAMRRAPLRGPFEAGRDDLS